MYSIIESMKTNYAFILFTTLFANEKTSDV